MVQSGSNGVSHLTFSCIVWKNWHSPKWQGSWKTNFSFCERSFGHIFDSIELKILHPIWLWMSSSTEFFRCYDGAKRQNRKIAMTANYIQFRQVFGLQAKMNLHLFVCQFIIYRSQFCTDRPEIFATHTLTNQKFTPGITSTSFKKWRHDVTKRKKT